MTLIEPFSRDYRPDTHPAGGQAIEHVVSQLREHIAVPMFVYPQKDRFIMSDDYIVYIAYVLEKQPYAACYIFGHSASDRVEQLEGPIPKEDVSRILGYGD